MFHRCSWDLPRNDGKIQGADHQFYGFLDPINQPACSHRLLNQDTCYVCLHNTKQAGLRVQDCLIIISTRSCEYEIVAQVIIHFATLLVTTKSLDNHHQAVVQRKDMKGYWEMIDVSLNTKSTRTWKIQLPWTSTYVICSELCTVPTMFNGLSGRFLCAFNSARSKYPSYTSTH